MKDEIRSLFHDIRNAAIAVKSFVAGKTFNDYISDEMLRSAVERKFEIMGEALNRLSKESPELVEKFRDHRNIISFRNILIHGYNGIDDRIVWSVIEDDLDRLLEDVNRLFGG